MRRLSAGSLVALTLALALAGCSSKTTQAGGLELILTTSSLQAGTDFDTIQLVIQQETSPGKWHQLVDMQTRVPSESTLPTTYSVQAGSSPDQDALIEVTALKNGTPLVQRVAQVQLPTDRVAELLMVLAANCVGKVTACSSGSCQPDTGLCGPNVIDPSTLPTYIPGESLDARFDVATGDASEGGPADAEAGGDATVLPDAGVDSTTGVCSPGTTMCTSNTQAATCGADGQWASAMTCPNVCVGAIGVVDGGCGGVCAPNATQCSGNGVQTCDSSGQWGAAVACPSSQGCSGGACVPQSCAPSGSGRSDCGSASESCCTSLQVPGGTFYRTYSYAGDGGVGDGGPGDAGAKADPASVSGFRLDKYLVTVGRFRRFVDAVLPADGGTAWTPPAGSGKHGHLNGGQGLVNSGASGGYEPGWLTSDNVNIAPTSVNLACGAPYDAWTDSPGSQENLPINCLNWYEAYAFCIWDGGFLPSDAELQYAVAGGSQQRQYPWGFTDPGTSNQYAIYGYTPGGCYYPATGACTGISNLPPVGTVPQGAGLWGQLDLAGEMFEWEQDYYAPLVNPCTDCADLTAATYRVVRGSAFDFPKVYTYGWTRVYQGPTARGTYDGLRCARAP